MAKQQAFSMFLIYLILVFGLALVQYILLHYESFIGTWLGNLFTFMVALTFLGGCVMLSLKARALPFPKWLLFFLCCFLYILLYMGIEAVTTIFFVTLDKEMIEAINLSVYESQDVIYMLLSEIPSQWWRLVTLADVSHLLDVALTTIYDAAFLSAFFVFWKD